MDRWLWLSVLVVVLDQGTKWLAETNLEAYRPLPMLPFFNLTLMYNEGAAFSFLADAGGWQRWFFSAFGLIMSAILFIWLLRLRPGERRLAAAIALILGGAVGNLIDRLMTGRVVDFLDLHVGRWHWPAFNIADIAITLGVVLMLVASLREAREGKREGT